MLIALIWWTKNIDFLCQCHKSNTSCRQTA